MSAAPRAVTVDVTSDPLCPFCYLGVTQLKHAAAKYNKDHAAKPIDLQWKFHAYALNPKLPETPETRLGYMTRNFGDTSRSSDVLAKKYAESGLKRADPATSYISSSFTAQRLIAYAQRKWASLAPHDASAKIVKLNEDIMYMIHTDGHHASDRQHLAGIAARDGVFDSEADAKTWLEGTDLSDEVKKGYAAASGQGIRGVPFFIFDDKYAGSGAVGEEGFEQMLEQVVQ
ncbi:hypothetical protein Q8F55_004275 [Vanrija albida]|uniref:DSBA-like thioredoxin domain-containing protein n=1 Tax=Vanrija albida TaxID=181172 RepID=A0ABR3Q6B4_9TREE